MFDSFDWIYGLNHQAKPDEYFTVTSQNVRFLLVDLRLVMNFGCCFHANNADLTHLTHNKRDIQYVSHQKFEMETL